MKRIILDENLPHPLRSELGEYEVFTVQYQGWSGIKNGELLKLIEGSFDVFLTADKNLRYQQNLAGRRVAIIELPFTRLKSLLPLLPQIRATINSTIEGGYYQVS